MVGKGKKKSKKQLTSNNKGTNNPNLWPDLPRQLLDLIARKSSLMQEIYSEGLMKSWRTQRSKCCKSSNPTPPWLELSNTHRNSHTQLHTFNIAIKMGYVWYWRKRKPETPKNHIIGCSHGLLVTKISDSDYSLWDPPGRWWRIPEWNDTVPFLRAALSSSPLKENSVKNKCIVMVLTGTTHPAFAFYRVWEGGDWIRNDSTIVDPNDHEGHLLKFSNGIWFKEKFYALSLQGTLAIIEEIDSDLKITALVKERAVPSVSCRHFKECLVESERKILLIFLVSRKSIDIVDFVEVYELRVDKLAWIKKENLEDRTLFIGTNCCISVLGNRVGCRGNCVYFSSNGDGWWEYEMETGYINPNKSAIWIEPNDFHVKKLSSNCHVVNVFVVTEKCKLANE